MRTPQQILNLRSVINRMHGPFVERFLSDKEVDDWANEIQFQVNKNFGYLWEVRVCTKENEQKDWNEIEKEPTSLRCSEEYISKGCISLLKKYPSIIAIKIVDSENISHEYIFNQEESEGYEKISSVEK